MPVDFSPFIKTVSEIDPVRCNGKVTHMVGLVVESEGPSVSVGEICKIYSRDKSSYTLAEVVGFKHNKVLLMPIGKTSDINPGSEVVPEEQNFCVHVGPMLLGRVLDGLGNPIDGKGPIEGGIPFPVQNDAPPAMLRKPISEPLEIGVKAIDGFLTTGKGQRIGIFSGSGVGKSSLMGMIARYAQADVNVIALIGERGREVNEFIQQILGPEGLKKSVVVVVTSEQPAILRAKGPMVATAIAEYFRDCGKDVVLMMDSLTRFAMAQREIGLTIGEPPTTKGYTPSVFAMIPQLIERAGNSDKGTITGIYTVLVEADDMNDPIADTARATLDGHIILSRELNAKNHFPSIDILNSLSRLMSTVADKEHKEAAGKTRELLAAYREAQTLIEIGAYVQGTNPRTDKAIELIEPINHFLKQDILEHVHLEDAVKQLEQIGSQIE